MNRWFLKYLDGLYAGFITNAQIVIRIPEELDAQILADSFNRLIDRLNECSGIDTYVPFPVRPAGKDWRIESRTIITSVMVTNGDMTFTVGGETQAQQLIQLLNSLKHERDMYREQMERREGAQP